MCWICDEPKHREREKLAPLPGSEKVTWCEVCGRDTVSRMVAGDGELLAPGSVMTFGEQRKHYRKERA